MSPDTWLRAQEVLAGHNKAGEDGQVQFAVVHQLFAAQLAVDTDTRITTNEITETPCTPSASTPEAQSVDTAFDIGGLIPTETILLAPRNPQVRLSTYKTELGAHLRTHRARLTPLAELPRRLSNPGSEVTRLLSWWRDGHMQLLAQTDNVRC
ncbi:hypothetical protein ACPXB3_04015 [Gordonia sp. DT219]|uniref:hypothetical protein n=1 Tax=Gordonia sp. DT219 TaxID=3416658 RepID=UPI003CFA2B28